MSIRMRIRMEDRALRQGIRQRRRAAADLSPVYRQIGEYLDLATRARFDRETDPNGDKWQPLSEDYLEWKRRKGKGHAKILEFHADLRDTMRYHIEGKSLFFGTNRKYAPAHQFGEGSPKRAFLGFDAQDKQEISILFERHLSGD
uniref:Phage virion morphogenesis (Putative tail completion) protein n=1 Tax=Candidatus Kentrum sp. UNK TaxID=2126344 RepID=A0A450ZWT2_9GAMM|nr:MAG: phage virion morphogenesis (putative tail completion) protein [Candidatus Kentron sp. UNK]VFK68313.1 MAG: phage virion morphogenesis (putative tail completion) protein [Candidatus Kentron sp. UNK]